MIDSFQDIEKELLAKGVTFTFSEGKYLFQLNDEPKSVFFIVKGEVLFESTDGSKTIIPNKKIYGLRDLLLGEPYEHSALTHTKVKVVIMDKTNIFSILTKHRKVIFQYIFSLGKKEIVYE